MKTSHFAVLLLALSPVLQAAPPDAAAAAPQTAIVENNGMVEILMADGTVRSVRKITGVTADSLRIMTDDGIGKIPLGELHPQSIIALNSMMETPEQHAARMQREAAAAASYRANQDLKERLAAQDNATMGASQRAEAARQEQAREAAAAAYAQQQAAFREMQQAQDAQRAQRKAERDAARAKEDQEIAMAAERQRQYEVAMATAAANAAAANAAAQQNSIAHPGPLAAMMSGQVRSTSGVDKLDVNEQTDLKNWVTNRHAQTPPLNFWEQKLQQPEKETMTVWLNQQRRQLFADQGGDGGAGGPRMPVESYLRGNFTGFSPGKIYHLANDQKWQQTESKVKSVTLYHNDTKASIHAEGSIYVMTVDGVGSVHMKLVR